MKVKVESTLNPAYLPQNYTFFTLSFECFLIVGPSGLLGIFPYVLGSCHNHSQKSSIANVLLHQSSSSRYIGFWINPIWMMVADIESFFCNVNLLFFHSPSQTVANKDDC